jgi:phosphoesterase RecJ-like protein
MSDPVPNSVHTSDPYRAIIDALGTARRVLVTTHVRPDGDALGSSVALILGLRAKGVDAELLVLSKLPRKYAFVVTDNGVTCHGRRGDGWPAALADLSRFDALAVCDTGHLEPTAGPERPGGRLARAQTRDRPPPHPGGLGDGQAGGDRGGGRGRGGRRTARPLGRRAHAGHRVGLFLGIASDTGWFQFANTRPHTFRLAARLVEAGVDTDRMYQLLYQNERAERVALQTRAQQSLGLLADGRLAVMRVTARDFAETGGSVADTENVINLPLQIRTVQASVLLTEPPEGGPIRVSLRSKGQIDVARLAERFGGGGHARAAGLKVAGTLAAAEGAVVAALTAALSAAPHAAK